MIAVIVAVIGGGGPLMWALSRLDKRNTQQHAASMEQRQALHQQTMDAIGAVRDDVRVVDQRLSDHIDWHLRSK